MPYLIMRRTDIPDGALQLLDLKPNTSQRNLIYEPPGQSKYVQNIPTQDSVATRAVGEVTHTNATYGGLAAYLIDNVEDGISGGAITAAVANAAATAIAAQAVSGAEDLALADLNGLIIGAGAGAGTGLTANESTGNVEEVLSLLAGRNYSLPAGSEIDDAGPGSGFVATRLGDFTEEFRKIHDNGSFRVSLAIGKISVMASADFEYDGTTGIAVDAFEDDGTRI